MRCSREQIGSDKTQGQQKRAGANCEDGRVLRAMSRENANRSTSIDRASLPIIGADTRGRRRSPPHGHEPSAVIPKSSCSACCGGVASRVDESISMGQMIASFACVVVRENDGQL